MAIHAKSGLRIIVYFFLLINLPLSAHAQDVATEHTQILNNVELISENLRQFQSLENEIEMIKNQVQELKSVANYQDNFSDVDSLRNNLTGVINQGTSLSNQTQAIMLQMQQELNTVPASGNMIDQQEDLDQGTLNIIQNTLSRVAQIRRSYSQAIDSVNALMDKNNQSVGQTQALQTANELNAQNIEQSQATQELLSEDITMQAAAMSKQLQEEQDEDNKMAQIFNSSDDGSSVVGQGTQDQ